MPRPLIFISHSAKDDDARDVLEQIEAKLRGAFDVFVDRKRLEAGMYWRRELDTWMGLCRGAVILFSRDALTSSWVRKEATILCARRAWDASFVLVPVRLPTVKRADLDHEDFSPLALNEIQMVTEKTTKAIVKKVAERFAPLAAGDERTPLRELERVIASMLVEVENKSPEVLVEAAGKLGASLTARLPGQSYNAQLARELINAEPQSMLEAFEVLNPYFADWGTAVRLFELLVPFWVDSAAVAQIPPMIKRSPKQRAVSVNGSLSPFTQKAYIRRARCGPVDWLYVQTTGARGFEENLDAQLKKIEEEIRTQIKAKLDISDDYDEDTVQLAIDSQINTLEKIEPLFVIVPRGLSEEVLTGLRDKFPAFTFFLLSGDGVPDAAQLKLKHIKSLCPPLTPGQEQAAFNSYHNTLGKVKRTPR